MAPIYWEPWRMKYRVIGQRVEIHGKTREVGDVLDEAEFRQTDIHRNDGLPSELSELLSLLSTRHVESVKPA